MLTCNLPGDVSTRTGPLILEVWDSTNSHIQFKEFENFVDFHSIDPDQVGCLLNGGAEQQRILKEHCVRDTVIALNAALATARSIDGLKGISSMRP